MHISLRLTAAATLFAVAMVHWGCSPSQEKARPLSADEEIAQLMQQWQSLIQPTFKETDVPTALAIAQRLSLHGDKGLEPLFQVLENDRSSPVAKVVAGICLMQYLKEQHEPRVLSLLGPERDATTRAAATQLLAQFSSPTAVAKIRELLDDKEHRVRATALVILLQRGEPSALERVAALLQEQETSQGDKESVALSIPIGQEGRFLDLYKEIAQGRQYSKQARQRAITVLGQSADDSVLAILEQIAGTEEDANLKTLAQSAVDALKSRQSTSPPA